MSTFVVTFLGDASEKFYGRARHVATGEEAKFASVTDLLVFFEEMNAVSGLKEAAFANQDPESDHEKPG